MFNPIACEKVLNSALVNTVPLSVTGISGRPGVANVTCIFSIVVCDVAVVRVCTSNHFECASKEHFPFKWTSIVGMLSGPRLLWPLPRM